MTAAETGKPAGLLALLRHVQRLKAVKRTGWLDRGITPRETESVADHTLGVALLAWAVAIERNAAGADLDAERVLKLALLHDLPEAETGDPPPYDPADVPDWVDASARRAFLNRRHVRDETKQIAKRANEDAAMARLLAELPAGVGAEISSLWQELRAGTTAEARLVKQVDRLETFLQSRYYLEANPGLPLDSFLQEVNEMLDDPLLAAVRDAELHADGANDR